MKEDETKQLARIDASARSDAIEELRVATAEEMLDGIAPRHFRWQPDPLAWIYRGQGNASWRLFAKAYRAAEKQYAAFGVECRLDGTRQAWGIHSHAEKELLTRFAESINRAGLPTPSRVPEVDPLRDIRSSNAETHPDAIPLLALAQHFGLPTKLLDWTRQARFAAYFAAASAAEKPHEDVELVVWALRTEFLMHFGYGEVDSMGLSLETAPASSNPNLHAQHGLFTRARGENAHLYPVDEFVVRASREPDSLLPVRPKVERPLMRCLRLPQREAPKLLRLLAYEGVTGSTMFPGYDGVVRAMKEEAIWDVRSRR